MAKREGSESGGRAEYWRELIEEWSASGLTQGDFCEEQGVSVASLRWWKWELNRREKTGKPTQPMKPKKPMKVAATTGLLPVRIVSSPTSSRDSCFEVVLTSGARIRVPRDFDPDALGRLITVVEAAAC